METNKNQMFVDDYLYYIRVYEDGESYDYEYGNPKHAMEHYQTELSKGNKVDMFRVNVITGKKEKYQPRVKCNCAKCTTPPKKIMPISRARR